MTEVGVAVFLAERTAGVKAKARGRSGHTGAETGLHVTDGDVSKPKGPLPESDTEDAGRKMRGETKGWKLGTGII